MPVIRQYESIERATGRPKVQILVILLFLFCLAFGRAYACPQYPQPALEMGKVTLSSGNSSHQFLVELAKTDQQRACGLMGRPRLADGRGMLFDMRPAGPAYFWMENTPEPLDMVFVDAEGKIIHLERNAVPYSRRKRGTDRPVSAVLELAAGTIEQLKIHVGDQLTLPWK